MLTHSPVASVRRPRVSDESAAIGLTADQMRAHLVVAAQHSPRSNALVCVLTFCGLRISEALGADVRDYSHDHGHRVLRITRKGGKAARVPLAPPVVRALDTYLGTGSIDERTAVRSSWPPLGALRPLTRLNLRPAGPTPRPMSRCCACAGAHTCPPGLVPTAFATPTPPRPCAWAQHCRTS
ncbi:tyrosine-type recombinase/integrase, partial [Quadrisphaera sp. INWT6]|uniref:tyrosine-type recombinase/integrase n=1 Tax=Quadrisphaera sp. INWT6 TaxID=2596917 RepID=UPI0035CCF8F3